MQLVFHVFYMIGSWNKKDPDACMTHPLRTWGALRSVGSDLVHPLLLSQSQLAMVFQVTYKARTTRL